MVIYLCLLDMYMYTKNLEIQVLLINSIVYTILARVLHILR